MRKLVTKLDERVFFLLAQPALRQSLKHFGNQSHLFGAEKDWEDVRSHALFRIERGRLLVRVTFFLLDAGEALADQFLHGGSFARCRDRARGECR